MEILETKRNNTESKNVTVIIPVYNSEKTIARTLDSLKKQKYREFKIIIVDDGSRDSTVEIAQKIVDINHFDCKIIKKRNEGVSIARNTGLLNTDTDYVTFLDSDDEYHEDYLKILVQQMEKNVDIAYAQYTMKEFEKTAGVNSYNISAKSKDEILECYFNKKINRFSFSNAMYRMDIIIKYKLLFPEHVSYGEDAEFICKYLFHCDRGGIFINLSLYRYWQQNNSAMHRIKYSLTQGIEAHQRILDYWGTVYNGDKNYIVDRVKWSCAMLFALYNKEYFKRFKKEYDVNSSMVKLLRSGREKIVKAGAVLYLISPWLFYYSVKIYGRFFGREG